MGDPIHAAHGSAPRVPDAEAAPAAAPSSPALKVNSPHCLEPAISDLNQLREAITKNPALFQSQILPQIVDHGKTEIQFEAEMNPGSYRGGVVVERKTSLHARLFMEDGRLRGTIDFFPPITKTNGILNIGDASLNQLQIETDPETNEIRFMASATYLNLPIPLIGRGIPMNVTEEITETLLGRRMSTLEGPLSRFLQLIMESARSNPPEDLVNLTTARFRIVANTRPGDAPLPELGDVSNASFHLDELKVSPTLTVKDVNLRLEIWPNEETGGSRIVIPELSIGSVRHVVATPCGGRPNVGSTLSNIRLNDVELELVPYNRATLAADLFKKPLEAMYPREGKGRILIGGASIQDDIVLNPLVGEKAVTFKLTGQANGDLSATVEAPEIGIDRAAVALGGQALQGQSASVSLDDALLRSLRATVSLNLLHLKDGEISYNAQVTPDLALAVLDLQNPEGKLLASAALMGLQSQPIATDGEIDLEAGTGTHRVHAEGVDLSSSDHISNVRWFNPPRSDQPAGTAKFGFNKLGTDLTLSTTGPSLTGLTVDRLALPEFNADTNAVIGKQNVSVSLSAGGATRRLPAGLGLTLDTTGPTAGITSTLSINTRTDRLRFSIPHVGELEMTGPLTGTIGVASTSTPVPPTFAGPAFRPVAGSLKLHLNGTVRQVTDAKGRPIRNGNLRLSGPIDITDTTSGRVVIAGRHAVSGPLDADTTMRIVADLKDQLRTSTSAVRYYDFDPEAETTIPLTQILLEAAVPGVGIFRTIGSGRISGLPKSPNFSATLPFGSQHLTIQKASEQLEGTVDLTGGGIDLNGTPKRVDIQIRPPEKIAVAFTQEQDGVTLTYAGELKSQSSIQTTIDPSSGRVSFRESGPAPQISGTLSVTATTMQDGKKVVLGSGQVRVSTSYTLTGHANPSGAHLTLSVPETGLEGELTSPVRLGENTLPPGTKLNLPIRGFGGKIDIDTKTLGLRSTWTAGDIGPARVEIPSLSLPGDIEFKKVTAEFSAITNGQQWEVTRDGAGRVAFRALPGADGTLPPFRVELGAQDAKGDDLSIVLGTLSRAKGIGGRIDPDTGEAVFDVTGITLGARLNGMARVKGQEIALSKITTDLNLPVIQVRIHQKTHELHLTARPPVPEGITDPPLKLASWLDWTTEQWRDYQTEMNTTTHLAVLSESTMSLPTAGDLFPGGRGQIYLDMKPLDLTARLDDPASLLDLMGQVRSALTMRREFPNPPPRNGDGEPILLSDAQRPLYRNTTPPGTLFFISERRPNGQASLDPELGRTLEESLGIPRDRVDRFLHNGRMEMDELVGFIRRDRKVAAAVSEETIADLVASYLSDSQGSFRRFSQRMAVTLGGIRQGLPFLLSEDRRGLRGIRAHQFLDSSFHAAGRPNDGTDMQFMAVLPFDSKKIGEILETRPTGDWDPWVSDSKSSDSVESGVLLSDHKYRVTRSLDSDGSIAVYRLLPSSPPGLIASSRTIRLAPLSDKRTLVIFDQHEDYPGIDSDIRLPRMRLPDRPPIDLTLLGAQAVGSLSRGGELTRGLLRLGGVQVSEPGPFPTAPFYANRFAQTADLLMKIGTGGAEDDRIAFDSRVPLSVSVSAIEFLGLDTTDASHPVLTVSPEASSEVIRPLFTSRLGVKPEVAERWITSRRIPLSDLMAETGLDQHFEPQVFQAIAQNILKPAKNIEDTMQHFTAPTERFLVLVEDLRQMGEILKPRGGGFGTRVRTFRDARFHQTSKDQIHDVIDNYMYWYVPPSAGVRPEDVIWFAHHAELFSKYDSNFVSSNIVPNSEIAGADDQRLYIDTGLVTPSQKFRYRISLLKEPLAQAAGTYLSAWRMERRPDVNDFLTNQGWWMALPHKKGGFVVVRGGVINTFLSADREPAFEITAGENVVKFMTNVLHGAQDHAKVPHHTIPYGPIPGGVVTETNKKMGD